MSGNDNVGGSGLQSFTLWVSIDGAQATPVGTPPSGTPIPAGTPNASGVYTITTTYQALSDGVPHTYRFFSQGIDFANNAEPLHTGANADIVVTAKFASAPLAVASLNIQHSSVGRSFIRYVDINFNQTGTVLSNLITNNRVRLVQHQLDGVSRVTDPTINLSGVESAIDHAIEFDFGVNGLGGNPISTAGDGYYEIDLDLAGNGTFSTKEYFYRLLGDVNVGSLASSATHAVDQNDLNAISAAIGQAGINLATDVNGDGKVNQTDLTLGTRSKGRQLGAGLHLDG
jgi:hypothetical protein